MKKYTINIVETTAYHVTVDARNEDEANYFVERMIDKGSYMVCDSERVEILTQDIQEVK